MIITPKARLIVSRNEQENPVVRGEAGDADRLLEAEGFVGPTAVLRGEPGEEELRLACRIVARYGKGRNESEVIVRATGAGSRRPSSRT